MNKPFRFEKFTQSIEQQIYSGALMPGHKLPSIRIIKAQFGLSSSSVQSGYEQLMFKGLVHSLPRSGYYVSKLPMHSTDKSTPQFALVKRDPVYIKSIGLTSKTINKPNAILFNETTPSDLLIPQGLILRTIQEIVREKGASLLRYVSPQGIFELRQILANRESMQGNMLNPEEILITDGGLQALYIALGAITNSGDLVAVESPCVFSVLEVLTSLHLRIIEIPIKNQDGMDTLYLEKVIEVNQVKAIVVTTNFHNPTGVSTSDLVKKKLIRLSEKHNIPIIENKIYGELFFNDSKPTCLKDLDNSGMVMSFSSVSKTLAPGIRLGWLCAGKFFSKAEKLRFALGRSVSPLNQELIIKLFSDNRYDRHLKKLRRSLVHQCDTTRKIIQDSFPSDTEVTMPQGGFSMWVKLNESLNMNQFYSLCEARGIYFTPGNTFSTDKKFSPYFRVIFAAKLTPSRVKAIQTAGELAKSLLY